MPIVRIPAELDEELNRSVPVAVRGHKKAACRVRFALGEYIRHKGWTSEVVTDAPNPQTPKCQHGGGNGEAAVA